MTQNRSISWLRIGAESGAIVASILMAFAIDAWWDRVLDRRAEQELLGALATEFEATLAELRRGHRVDLERREAASTLVALDSESINALDLDQLAALYRQASRPDTADPPTGVLNSTVASGTLALIQNRELAALLSGWGERLVDMRNTETDMRDYLLLVLAQNMAPRAVMPYGNAPAGEGFDEALLEVSTKSHLNYIVNLSNVNLRENEQLQTEAAAILDRIGAVLEEN